MEHTNKPDIFCSCADCEAYYLLINQALRTWKIRTKNDEDTTDQAKEDQMYQRENMDYQQELNHDLLDHSEVNQRY